MKKIALIIILSFSLNLAALTVHDKSSSNNAELNLLYATSSDSLRSVIEGRPMILYMSGHGAHIWSMVLQNNDRYQIICGRINPYGENKIYEPTDSTSIDTAAFLEAHKTILSWGLDTLPIQAKRMKAVKRTTYSPFSTTLSTTGPDSTTTFISLNAAAFSGPDSVGFNSRYKQLSYLMYWLAQPFTRPYTPDSVFITKKAHGQV